MARKKRKKNHQRPVHREPIVREVARLLQTGTPTHWRFTSEARHGLRAAMCLKGTPWAIADKRAEEIVTLARHRIGLSLFPTWSQVQGAAPETREYFFCASCGGFMQRGADRPWCSDECREALKERRRTDHKRRADEARQRAVRVVLTGGAAEPPADYTRACRGCGKLFKPGPNKRRQRYCGHSCSAKRPKYFSRPCLVCAEPFQPWHHTQLTCGPACSREKPRATARAGRNTRTIEKTCVVCGNGFTTTRKLAVACSPECREAAYYRHKRAYAERLKAKRAQRTIERECVVCGSTFAAQHPNSRICSERCRNERYPYGWPGREVRKALVPAPGQG